MFFPFYKKMLSVLPIEMVIIDAIIELNPIITHFSSFYNTYNILYLQLLFIFLLLRFSLRKTLLTN